MLGRTTQTGKFNMLCAVTPKKITIAPNQNTRRWPSSKIDFTISPYTAVLFSGWFVIIGHLVFSGYPVVYPKDAIWAPCSALKLHGGKLQTRFIRRSLHPNFIGCPEAHFESSGSLRLVVFSLFKGWLPLSPPPACYLVKELGAPTLIWTENVL